MDERGIERHMMKERENKDDHLKSNPGWCDFFLRVCVCLHMCISEALDKRVVYKQLIYLLKLLKVLNNYTT